MLFWHQDSREDMKKFGLLENSSRGIWALSKPDIDVSKLDYLEVVRTVRELNKTANGPNQKSEKEASEIIENEIKVEVELSEDWKEKLLNILYNITPAAFERLAQRLLR